MAEDLTDAIADDFTWRDGERMVRFGPAAAVEAPALLEQDGFEGFVLLTTERAMAVAPGLAERAAAVEHVPAGRVDEISAALLDRVPGDAALVAVGGGRVVDTGKALAGARGVRCAAIPTTLSGAEMTPFHRLPSGVEGARMVRPALVIADPRLMASAPVTRLAASAMNALAHAMESLYTPMRSPVTDLAALRAAALIAEGVTRVPEAGGAEASRGAARDAPAEGASAARARLALGALLAGYASGCAGIAFHHAVCQSVVRTAGSPHAATNAVVLPHSARLMAGRAPGPMSELAAALGDGTGDPEAAAADIARIAARCGHTRLATLGVTEEHLPAAVQATLGHPALANSPDPPGEAELLDLLRAAL